MTIQTQNNYSEIRADVQKVWGGKYLTFHLGTEEFGLKILQVREIIGLMRITKIPQSPAYIRGVINLRGKIIPVLSLRLRFGMEAVSDTDQTCVIVVDIKRSQGVLMVGLVVDSVSEVLNIQEDRIEDAPTIGSGAGTAFILGIAKIRDEVKILLDIDRVFEETDLSSVTENEACNTGVTESATG